MCSSPSSWEGLTLLVTPGNHENWDHIDHPLVDDRADGRGPVKWFTNHIAVLPRGHRFAIAGVDDCRPRFVSLGGTPSIDFRNRVIGRSR